MIAPLSRCLTPAFEVEEIPDLVFAESRNSAGQVETLALDVYLPAGDPAELRPVVLWFHGGGFAPGNDRKQVYIPRLARAFAARGLVGVAPDYRVRANGAEDWPGTVADAVEDGRKALEWVHANHQAYRIDPRQVILAGGSAGGILVLNLEAQRRTGALALVDLWGPPLPVMRIFGALERGFPPVFIAHGTADDVAPYPVTETFVQELAQAGAVYELMTLPGEPHTPLHRLDEIIARAAAFLARVTDQSGEPARELFADGSLSGEGRMLNGKRHGPWKFTYKNGVLKATGVYLEGELDGYWEWWWDSGLPLQAGAFANGKQVGYWKRYFKNGQLWDEGEYADGKKTGEWKVYNQAGELVQCKVFKRTK